MDVYNDKDINDNIYEYVTLTCQKSTIDTIAATVHLKIMFYDNIDDDQPIALKVSTVIVEADTILTTTNINGMYEGYVFRDKVATSSPYLNKIVTEQAPKTGDNELVRIWLQEARTALTGCVSSNDSYIDKYVYYLQQGKIENNEDLSHSIMFSWKMKHPFGLVPLGDVRLFKIPDKLLESVSVQFIKPLIYSLTAERKHHKEVDNIAANNSDKLLKDNQLLLDQLQLVAESRQRDDHLLMVRFKEVLNTKKLQLAAKEHELSQLKKQQQHNLPVLVIKEEEEKVTTGITNQGHGRGHRKTKLKIASCKDQTTDNKVVAKRRRQPTIQYDNNINNYNISASEIKQKTTDKHQAFKLQHIDDKQLQEKELMKINLISSDSTDKNAIVDIKTAAMPSMPENIMLVNNNCFTADTQIDDIPAEVNIPNQLILKNPITTLNYSQISSNHNNSSQIYKKKTILDNLWSGIL